MKEGEDFLCLLLFISAPSNHKSVNIVKCHPVDGKKVHFSLFVLGKGDEKTSLF